MYKRGLPGSGASPKFVLLCETVVLTDVLLFGVGEICPLLLGFEHWALDPCKIKEGVTVETLAMKYDCSMCMYVHMTTYQPS